MSGYWYSRSLPKYSGRVQGSTQPANRRSTSNSLSRNVSRTSEHKRHPTWVRKDMDMDRSAGTLWLSPSRLEIALDCLYRWNGQYGQKTTSLPHPTLPNNTNGHAVEGPLAGAARNGVEAVPAHSQGLLVGNAAHAVLAKLFAPTPKLGKDPVGPDSEDWEDYLRSLVTACVPPEVECEEHDQEKFETTVFSILKYAYPKLRPKGKVLGVEADLSCNSTIGGRHVHLTCRADRIELHGDGTLEILDYKTNGNGSVLTPRVLAAHLPSYLYFLVPWQRYRRHPLVRNIVVSQVNLISLKTSVADYDQAQIIENREALRCCIEALTSGPYDPTPGPFCRWCPLREACPAWEDAELDMDSLDGFDQWRHRD